MSAGVQVPKLQTSFYFFRLLMGPSPFSFSNSQELLPIYFQSHKVNSLVFEF